MRSSLLFFIVSMIFCSPTSCSKWFKRNEPTNDKCIYIDEEKMEVYLYGCKENEYCNLITTTCESLNDVKNFPGEICKGDSNCYSNNCTKGHCIGKKNGEECYGDIDCDAGLFCKTSSKNTSPIKICAPVISTEGDPCDSKNDAIKCSPNLVCNNGTCVKHGSVPVGHEIDGSEFACATLNATVENGTKICSEGLKLGRSTYKSCPASGNCPYKLDGKLEEQPCNCTLDGSGLSYCFPKLGDFDLEDVRFFLRIDI